MVSFPVIRAQDDFLDVYAEHAGLVRAILRNRFKVPAPAVDDLVQDVFLSYFLARDSVRNVRSWLLGAACNASRRYWATHDDQKEEPFPEGAGRGEEEFLRVLIVRQVVQRLHPKCRRTLELRYWQGATMCDIAEHLGTTTGYAKKLVRECLRKAFDAWHDLWRER